MSLLSARRRMPVTVATGGAASLRVRLSADVRVRHGVGTAIAYVPRRDHFFALDARHATLVRNLRNGRWDAVGDDLADAARTLAELGICETDPGTPRRAFFGRSVVGHLDELPAVREPLVVNCFATSHCPVRCLYCHADDLMVGYRDSEAGAWLDQVLRVAAATPAMVGVVTGGEPLARYERTERLVNRLADSGKAVVLDTSGVGDFSRMVPLLLRHRAHVRVSLDSADPAVNDTLRPANRRFVVPGTSSSVHAVDAIRRAVREGVPCSVQTVVTSLNGDTEALLALRDKLVGLSVTTWVLHVVVPVGKAARRAQAGLLTGPDAIGRLENLVARTAAEGVPIDIRLTRTDRAPNSTLLVSAKGELAVEDVIAGGKKTFALPKVVTRGAVLRVFRAHVDLTGHTGRYLNGSLEAYPGVSGAILPRA